MTPSDGYPLRTSRSPAGQEGAERGMWSRPPGGHAPGAREDSTAVVILQDRGDRGHPNVARVNVAPDPFAALDRGAEYLDSVLRRMQRRDEAAADAWCWVVIHLLDAVCAAVQRRETPDPWFAARRNWGLNPAGWAPLVPLTRTITTKLKLTEEPQ
jgi:hypothetical protein